MKKFSQASILIILAWLVSGCAIALPALGTGSAAADLVLGEVIRAGAAELAPDLVKTTIAGVDRLSRFAGRGPSLPFIGTGDACEAAYQQVQLSPAPVYQPMPVQLVHQQPLMYPITFGDMQMMYLMGR